MNPLLQVLTRLDKARQSEHTMADKSNFELLDIYLERFSNPGLYCIAGKHQRHNTAFIISLTNSLPSLKTRQIGILSLRMSAVSWIECYLSNISEIWYEKIQRGIVDELEMKTLSNIINMGLCDRIHIQGPDFLESGKLTTLFDYWKTNAEVKAIFIDGVQNLPEKNNGAQMRLTRSFVMLKQLSIDLGIPIILTWDQDVGGFEFLRTESPAISLADACIVLHKEEKNSDPEKHMYMQKENICIRIEKNNFGVAFETLSFRPMLHIQKFTEWDF